MKRATNFGNALTVDTLVRESLIFDDMWKENTLKCKLLATFAVWSFLLVLV